MNSIGDDCNELKTKYDACFNQWFSEKFLKGNTDDSQCKPLFRIYQKCVQDALTLHQIDIKDLKTNHINGSEFENVKTSQSDTNNMSSENDSSSKGS